MSALTAPDSRFQTLFSTPVAFAIGVVGAVLTVLQAEWLGVTVGCLSLVVLYASYGVMSLIWGSPAERLTEWSFGLVGATAIVLALAVDPRWLALGWAAHGVWDLLHRRDHHVIGLRGIPPWWINSCLVWDVPAALGIVLVL